MSIENKVERIREQRAKTEEEKLRESGAIADLEKLAEMIGDPNAKIKIIEVEGKPRAVLSWDHQESEPYWKQKPVEAFEKHRFRSVEKVGERVEPVGKDGCQTTHVDYEVRTWRETEERVVESWRSVSAGIDYRPDELAESFVRVTENEAHCFDTATGKTRTVVSTSLGTDSSETAITRRAKREAKKAAEATEKAERQTSHY